MFILGHTRCMITHKHISQRGQCHSERLTLDLPIAYFRLTE
jgi:hypothetical protein